MTTSGPFMNRSRLQLAVSYAPGSYFTFEGGRGCFISMPGSSEESKADKNLSVRQQIGELFKEFVTNWYQRAATCRDGDADPLPVHPEQAIDPSLLLHGVPDISMELFSLVVPSRVGYAPAPLNFCCSSCGLLHNFNTVDDLYRGWNDLTELADCTGGGKHDWRQLDVFFFHWSGSVAPLHPNMCSCSGTKFKLFKSLTGVFTDWRFQCCQCGDYKNLLMTDTATEAIFRRYPGARHILDERTMVPISYRASAVFYPQSERFIPHDDPDLVALLEAGREDELSTRLMKLYGYLGQETTLDNIRATCQAGGPEKMAIFHTYEENVKCLDAARARGDESMAAIFRQIVETLQKGLVPEGAPAIPAPLWEQVMSRHTFTRKFDPIRIGMEHASIVDKYLGSNNRSSHSDLVEPPEEIRPEWAFSDVGKARYRAEMEDACARLGIERISLINRLDLVQFSFGYSRVAHGPVYRFKERAMPVRLNLFPHVGQNQRPIYTLEQKNEAIYIRLKQEDVIRWLEKNGVPVLPALAPGQKLGARYIEQYGDFGYYLQQYTRKGVQPRTIANMVYLLLHTMSHQMIHVVSEYSGLDLGSLGECIFPADLAFIVYRSSLTPDLRNLSSMVRNFGATVLRDMYEHPGLQCGSGSLCDQRGGACPGCIMVPDVACIAWNNLLSRSALGGGTTPEWDNSPDRRMYGFLEVTGGVA